MKVLELLIPTVIRELFMSKDSSSVVLALKLASPFQYKVLLHWYVMTSMTAGVWNIPYIDYCSSVYPGSLGDEGNYYTPSLWEVIRLEPTVSEEIKLFLK